MRKGKDEKKKKKKNRQPCISNTGRPTISHGWPVGLWDIVIQFSNTVFFIRVWVPQFSGASTALSISVLYRALLSVLRPQSDG